jgi:hypothetical protein
MDKPSPNLKKPTCIGQMQLLLVVLLLTVFGPVHAQPQQCDCNCSEYEELVASAPALHEKQIDRIDQCGRECAIAWACCDENLSETEPAPRPDLATQD